MSQLNDQTEQQLFNGFTAESADELQSQFEKQVYNAYTAAGGGGGGAGGGGTGPSPATTKPLADAGTGAVGTSLAYARADHQHPSSGGGGELPELTEEHVVGYFNGKPVYEIFIVTSTPNTSSETFRNVVDLSSLFVDFMFPINASVLTQGTRCITLPYFANSSIYIAVAYDNSWLIEKHMDKQFHNVPLIITLRYTKNTD